jgi:opacity protein-like surface antigen
MKKLLLASCLVVLCASSLKAEDVQQQANWKESAAKYGKIAGKGLFVYMCAYNMRWISKFPWNPGPGTFNVANARRNYIITLVAGIAAAKSALNDLRK